MEYVLRDNNGICVIVVCNGVVQNLIGNIRVWAVQGQRTNVRPYCFDKNHTGICDDMIGKRMYVVYLYVEMTAVGKREKEKHL